jgi:GT2 family glycosyltransferase
MKSSDGGHGQGSGEVIPVVILNWNGGEDTVECLRSIRRGVAAGFVPVVVDNGSGCESLEKLKCECGRIFRKVLFLREGEISSRGGSLREEFAEYLGEGSLVFIENGENLGFAKGNNVGIRVAELIGAEWMMLLNNDTVVAPDMFERLRRSRTTDPFRRSHRRSDITSQRRESKIAVGI